MSVENCDGCGAHNNVSCDTWVNERMRKRGWHMNSEHGDLCPDCVRKTEEAMEDE